MCAGSTQKHYKQNILLQFAFSEYIYYTVVRVYCTRTHVQHILRLVTEMYGYICEKEGTAYLLYKDSQSKH